MTSEESKAAASPLRPALYLIPSTMSDASVSDVIPERNLTVLRAIRHFVVENVRTVRRFLKRCDRSIDIDSLSFTVLDEHTAPTEVSAMLALSAPESLWASSPKPAVRPWPTPEPTLWA